MYLTISLNMFCLVNDVEYCICKMGVCCIGCCLRVMAMKGNKLEMVDVIVRPGGTR